ARRDRAGTLENAVGQRRLAVIDVGNDREVADPGGYAHSRIERGSAALESNFLCYGRGGKKSTAVATPALDVAPGDPLEQGTVVHLQRASHGGARQKAVFQRGIIRQIAHWHLIARGPVIKEQRIPVDRAETFSDQPLTACQPCVDRLEMAPIL